MLQFIGNWFHALLGGTLPSRDIIVVSSLLVFLAFAGPDVRLSDNYLQDSSDTSYDRFHAFPKTRFDGSAAVPALGIDGNQRYSATGDQ